MQIKTSPKRKILKIKISHINNTEIYTAYTPNTLIKIMTIKSQPMKIRMI